MESQVKGVLTRIGNSKHFNDSIEKITLDQELDFDESTYLLSCAILFLRHYEKDKRYTSYADLAYYIILKYSIRTDDYQPLYDYSISFGFYPIAYEILRLKLIDTNSLQYSFDEKRLSSFARNDEYIETLEQSIISEAFLDDPSNEKSYLAPTSFGKSSIIIDYLKRLNAVPNKVVIVVPTKSLLAQTYQMIRNANLDRKILIHDEMYNNEDSFIAIFTQERALRLLSKNNNTYYDVLFVDEAHNIFKKDPRSILLSRLLSKNLSLNPDQKVIYLSPLVEDETNLRVNSQQEISAHHIKFNVKEPDIFEYRNTGEIYKYNRFVNKFFQVESELKSRTEYLILNSGKKNFLYNYRPVKIERLAARLAVSLPEIQLSDELEQLKATLKREVHKDFYCVDYIKFGMIYIHGQIPDLIKEYIESKYKKLDDLKYILANSVILEGMNLPIDTLFIYNTNGLKGKELMNLIGRVNRLNYVFNNETNQLSKLLPQVHFINSDEFNRKDGKMENQIAYLRSRVFPDEIKNPTLESFDIDKLKISKKDKEKEAAKFEVIRKNEEFLFNPPTTIEDQFKQYLIESGVNLFYTDIDVVIDSMTRKLQDIRSTLRHEWNEWNMLKKINFFFVQDLNVKIDGEIRRLKSEETQNYYEFFINVGMKRSLNENIISQVEFFKKKANSDKPKMYFGGSYGEEPYSYDTDEDDDKRDDFIDLRKKDEKEMVNLAVVKLKMEESYVSFKLNKLIVMLYDYGLISRDDYHQYVYGTTDSKKIELTKYGLNIGLIARLQESDQIKNLTFDANNNLNSNPQFNEYLDTLNDFHQFEIKRFIVNE